MATLGVIAGLQRAVSGLDTGREAASPRVRARLRRMAGDLAVGGVERVPQLQEGLGRVAPKAPSPAAALAVRCPCCRLTGTFGSLQRHRSARDCDGVTGGRGEGRGSRFREHRRDGPGHVRDWGLGGG